MIAKFIINFFHVIAVLLGVWSAYALAPWLERQYFPVVGKLQINSIEAVNQNQTLVRSSFEKLRDCDYIGIAWYRGNRQTGFARVPIELGRKTGDLSSPNRALGKQVADPWIVNMPASEIRNNSFVELAHRCWPWWTTTTQFYP